MIEEKKTFALKEFKTAQGEYLISGTEEAWDVFCKAKARCARLGIDPNGCMDCGGSEKSRQ